MDEATPIIRTARFGPVAVERESVWIFERGILGFPGKPHWLIIENKPGDMIVYLQSVDDPKLSFAIIDVSPILPEYRVGIDPKVLEEMGLRLSDLRVMVIINVADKRTVFLNLKCPLIFNPKTRQGRHVVMPGKHSLRHRLMLPAQAGPP